MAVNTAEVISVYSELLVKITTEYNILYVANTISSKQYSDLLSEVLATLMRDVIQAVQAQEKLDIENKLTQVNINKGTAEIARIEAEEDVAKNTAEGYKADSMFKIYTKLQELLFSLANSGLVEKGDEDSDTIYRRIVTAMEQTMNEQAKVWGYDAFIDLNGSDGNEGV